MPTDTTKITGARRAKLIDIGREFSSSDTRDQATAHLGALENFPLMLEYLEPDDVADLANFRDLIMEKEAARTKAGATKKTTNTAWTAAMREGKQSRRLGRGVLETAQRRLSAADDALADDVESLLDKTRKAGADPTKLGAQLKTLRAQLAAPRIGDVVRGPARQKAIAALTAAETKLTAASRTGRPGTPAETEELDLLDGLIVELCREFRGFARTAADEHGQPAIATAFELVKLYPARRAPADAKTEPPKPPVVG